MDSIQLTHVLKKNKVTRSSFQEVLPYDKVHRIQPNGVKNISYIVNSANSRQPGSHWVSLFGNRDRICFYDPLGLDLVKYYRNLYLHLKKITLEIVYFNIQIQPFNTDTCGEFCCVFIWLKGNGLSLSQIYQRFFKASSPRENQHMLLNFTPHLKQAHEKRENK